MAGGACQVEPAHGVEDGRDIPPCHRPMHRRNRGLPFVPLPRDSQRMVGRHLRITGRVQGVGYREWFRTRADSLGLTGWVRNRADGSVEALVQGDNAALTRMIAEAADGPPAARVAHVVPSDAPLDPALTHFERRPTL